MKLIFISGSYSAVSWSQIQDNIKLARDAQVKLTLKGWAVLCPHTNTGGMELLEAAGDIEYKDYLDQGLAILERCDAIFMLKDWQRSHGAKLEHKYADIWEKQIYYEVDGYPRPEKDY